MSQTGDSSPKFKNRFKTKIKLFKTTHQCKACKLNYSLVNVSGRERQKESGFYAFAFTSILYEPDLKPYNLLAI